MATKSEAWRAERARRQQHNRLRRRQETQARRRRWLVLTAWAVGLAVVAAVVAAMMVTSRPTSSGIMRPAPEFTLTDTTGTQVRLADYRGRNVVLYFSEGAGCGSCLQQMAALEQDATFVKAGIAVVPIVMNTREQITHDVAQYGVKTPFLLDDGTVSAAYGTLGKGMHADLPGHSFVLIDENGQQRWYGEYPSMWLAPAELLRQINKHLAR